MQFCKELKNVIQKKKKKKKREKRDNVRKIR